MKAKRIISSIILGLLLVAISSQIISDFRGLLLEEDTIELSELGDDFDEEKDLLGHDDLCSPIENSEQLFTRVIQGENDGLTYYLSVYRKIPIPPPEFV